MSSWGILSIAERWLDFEFQKESVMKLTSTFLLLCAAVALAGCAGSNQGGAYYEQPQTGYGEGASPYPAGPPTFSPGMNSRDIRDPSAMSRPEPPSTQTPTSPPNTPPRMSPGATP